MRLRVRHQILLKQYLKLVALIILFLTIFRNTTKAQQTETFPSGSYIVNMGITPQTVGNGLKPYGMMYDLIRNYNVPIKWVINPSKVKDGIDFTFNGISYRGGTFIIPGEFVTPTVTTRVNFWITQGVVVNLIAAPITVNVSYTLKAAPRWVLDAQNGKIAIPFFANAGIPTNAYYYKAPAQLGNCDDIYVMPHADPTWATHRNLFYWNATFKGALWAGCHAVSVLENTNGPDINDPSITRRLNFLMNNGPTPSQNALSFLNHSAGTPPYVQQASTHPIMQFMGKTDLAHTNGSEQIYMPFKPGGSWRSTTIMGAFDPSQANVPTNSDGPAAAIAFGRGFGDNNRGWVLYEGGHNIASSTGPDNVAAQRAFFNFSFLAAQDRQPSITPTASVPSVVYSGQTYNVSATATSPVGSGNFTYQWISSCGGTFANPTAASTTFTAPAVVSNSNCAITLQVTDDCGRVTFQNQATVISPGQRNPICVPDVGNIRPASCNGSTSVTVNVLANDSDPDGDLLTATLLTNGANGTFTNMGNGNISYTPNIGFIGTDVVTYQVCDNTGRCCTSTLTITVGELDMNGCSSTQYWGVASIISALRGTIVSGTPSNVSNSLDESDGDPADNTTFANFSNTNQSVIYTLSDVIPASGTLRLYVDASSNGRLFTVSQSTDSISFTNAQQFTVSDTDDFDVPKNYTVNAGTKFIRITIQSTSIQLDAMEYDVYGCLDATPVAANDETIALEDQPIIIDVLDNDNNPADGKLVVSEILTQPLYGKVSINTDGTITYLNLKDNIGPAAIDSFQYRTCSQQGLCSTAWVVINLVEDNCSANQYKTTITSSPISTTLYATKDAYIRSRNASTNYGSDNPLKIKGTTGDVKRALVEFNLAGIPANAIIDSASFSLYMSKNNSSADPLAVHRVTRSWTQNGVTWNRFDGASNWTTAGGDFNPTVIASLFPSTNNIYHNWNVLSLVQNWVNGIYPNNGVIVKRNPDFVGSSKDMQFRSIEETGTTRDPRLFIRYRVPASCVTIPSRAPLAMPDTATTNAVTSITINTRANDYDYNASGLTVQTIGSTSIRGGSISVNSNNIIYTPPISPYINGVDTFSYRVASAGLWDTAFVYVRVTNAPPFANRDNYTLSSNTVSNPTSLTATVMSNDFDPEGSSLSAPSITMAPKNGTATISGNNIIYTPSTNFIGNDTLIYQISETGSCSSLSDTALVVITVNNRIPTAVNDPFTFNRCEVRTISVLANDTDPENSTLTIVSLTQPAVGNGTVALTNNGTQVTYTPPNGGNTTNNPVTFTYRVQDANGGISAAAATVTITFRAVPVYQKPVARRDTFEMYWNGTLYADVLTNDFDPDGRELLTPVTILTNATKGTTTALSNGLVQYTPNSNTVTYDSFRYIVRTNIVVPSGCSAPTLPADTAWAFIIVQNVPEANADLATTNQNTQVVINVLLNDIFGLDGPSNGPISIISSTNNGTLTVLTNGSPTQALNTIRYTPNNGFYGKDSFIYQLCDTNGDCDTALVVITVLKDTDGDGRPDILDIDDDNDGIADIVEVCGSSAVSFACVASDPSLDDDDDGIPNWRDSNWGTLNANGCVASLDIDGDGIPDFLDLDSDNDGIQDVIEAYGVDVNGDGIIDNFVDANNDGLSDNAAVNNSIRGLGAPDFDGDGIPNFIDLDSDNDGIPDIIEAGGVDGNQDGLVDSFVDSNGNGYQDNLEGNNALIMSGADTNSNGIADSWPNKNADRIGYPNLYDLDSDGDGLLDVLESGLIGRSGINGTVAATNGIVTGTRTNGWANTARGIASLNLTNTDGDLVPDYLDIDSDNDGITDNVEAQSTSGYKVPSDVDTDGDGINDIYEVLAQIGTYGGGGLTPFDKDGDGTPDYRDTDTDNDGVPDRNEGDRNSPFRTITQATINASGDADGDGLMDVFDNVSISTLTVGNFYKNVTMGNMGPLGNFEGPTPTGSLIGLQQSDPSGDRDWRNLSILPLTVTTLNVSYQAPLAKILWQVQNEYQTSFYDVEFSKNGVDFEKITTTTAKNTGASNYNFTHNLLAFNSSIYYYRIKQVNQSGKIFYTQVVTVKEDTKNEISIHTNPFISQLGITYKSTFKEKVILTLLTTDGKLIKSQSHDVLAGANSIVMNELNNLISGMYILIVQTNLGVHSYKVLKK